MLRSLVALLVAPVLLPGAAALSPTQQQTLAARGGSPAAFDGRCIPPLSVARRLNTPGIRAPRALIGGRLARLGATRHFHDGLLALQVQLDRAHFSPGEIDGRGGSNTRAAQAAFAAAGLTLDGAPATITYTITDADAAGPYAPVPEDLMEQSKLPALSYASILEALAERFHASPALLQALNPQATFAAGERIEVPNVERTPLAGVAKVVVDQSDRAVMALDQGGKVIARYPATMGSERDPLPVGEWKINGASKGPPEFHYNPDLFWDADVTHSKAKIAPGPNNPVGLVWIDLSKEHYGIHGTPRPENVGKTQSHGCIRLTNWDALELGAAVKAGMPAVLQE